jgi:hypothetical protein
MRVVKGAVLSLIVLLAGALLLAGLSSTSTNNGGLAAFNPSKSLHKRTSLPPASSAEENSPLIPYKGERPSISSLQSLAEENSGTSGAERAQRIGEAKRLAASAAEETSGAQASLYYAGFEPLRYNDGYVQHRPHVYVTFWGKGWNNQSSTREKTLDLYRWMSGSNYSQILNQYFDHSGPIGNEIDLTSYTDTREDPEKVTAASIREEVAYSINHQGWGTPSYENQYVVIMSPQATFTKGLTGFCGAHAWWGEGHNLAFTIAGWPSEGCYEAGAIQPWQSLQETLSHEWAEAATDPIPVAPYRGWSNSHWESCEGKCGEIYELFYSYCAEYYCLTNEEVADECGSGEDSGYWLNKLYDNYLWKATGAYCVAHDASPVRYAATVEQPILSEATHTAEMRGSINPAGYWDNYQFELKRPGIEYSKPGEFNEQVFSPVSVSGTTGGLTGETTYQVKLNSTSELTMGIETGTSAQWGGEISFTTPNWHPTVTNEAQTEVKAGHAMLHGTIDPQGYETKYRFEWGKTTSYGSSIPVPDASIGSSTSNVAVEQKLEGLKGLAEYHYRLVASNAEGTTTSADRSFTTPDWRPVVTKELAWGIKAGKATLEGKVNPKGFATHYRFEWGTDTEFKEGKYGHLIPVPDASVGSGEEDVQVSRTIEGIKGEKTYHYRLVAENEQGVTKGEDKSFYTGDWRPQGYEIEAVDIQADRATLTAAINAQGFAGTYHFAWGTQKEFEEGKYTHLVPVPDESVGSGEELVEVSKTITSLTPRTPYHFVLVTENEEGKKTSVDQRFATHTSGLSTGYGVKVKGTPSAEGFNLNLNGIASICKGGSFEATVEGGIKKLTPATMASLSCTSSQGSSLGLNMHGCKFEFAPGAEDSVEKRHFAGEMDIGPPGCGPITLTVNYCPISIPPQNGSHANFVNQGEGSSETVTINAVSSFHYLQEGATGYCTKELRVGGGFSGSWEVKAEGTGGTAVGAHVNPFFEVGPALSGEAATGVGATVATLTGAIDSMGAQGGYAFQYGPTTEYGSTTGLNSIPGEGKSPVVVESGITELKPSTNYHFRLYAVNGNGSSLGPDRTFTTLPSCKGSEGKCSWSLKTTPNPALPPNPVNKAELNDTSCVSSSLCLAVGYDSNAGKSFERRWNGSEWKADEGFGTYLANRVNGVGCASASECLAVGYSGTAAKVEVWGESPIFGWTQGNAVSVPAVEGASEAKLTRVACSSSSACTAVGSYVKEGKTKTLAIRLTRKEEFTWSAALQTAANPASGNASLSDVSCPSSTYCTAVGGNEGKAFIESWNGSTWSLGSLPSPEGAKSTYLQGVSCTSASACTAAGSYISEVEVKEGGKPTGAFEEVKKPLALRWNGSSWSIQTTPAPSPDTHWALLNDVSCTGSNACTAVGSFASKRESPFGYYLSPSEEKTLAMSWNGSEWSIQSSPNPEGKTFSVLSAVSCPAQTFCAGVGSGKKGSETATLGVGYE